MLLEDATEGESYIDSRNEKATQRGPVGEKTPSPSSNKVHVRNQREVTRPKRAYQPTSPEKPGRNFTKLTASSSTSLHLPRLVNNNNNNSVIKNNRISSDDKSKHLPDVADDDCPVCRSNREAVEQARLDKIAETISNKVVVDTSNNNGNNNKSVAFTIPIDDIMKDGALVQNTAKSPAAEQPSEPQKDRKTPAPRPESRAKSGFRRIGPPPSSLAIPVLKEPTVKEKEAVPNKAKFSDAIPEELQPLVPILASELSIPEPRKSVASLPPIFSNNNNNYGAGANNNTRQIDSTFAHPQLHGTVVPTPTPPKSISQVVKPPFNVPPRLLAGLSPRVSATPLDTELAIRLKVLVFGSQYRKPSDAWRFQSLAFAAENGTPSTLAPRFVLIQRPNTGSGTTGALAVVQAELIKQILYCNGANSNSVEHKPQTKQTENPFNILRLLTRSQRSEALAAALAEIIYRAATSPKSPFNKSSNKGASLEQEHVAKVVLPCGRRVLPVDGCVADDGIIEKLLLFTFPMNNDAALLKELRSFFRQNLVHYDTDGSGGVLLLIYSVVLSRGIDTIYADFDESSCSSLITADSYTSTEAINLLLSGIATSYLFNDDIHISVTVPSLSSSSSTSSVLTQTSSSSLTNTPEVINSNSAMSSDSSGEASFDDPSNNNSNNNCQSNGVQVNRRLRGIHHRCDIGFLTLNEFISTNGTLFNNPALKKEHLEQMQLAKVGSYLKTPRYPIWVAAITQTNTRYAVLYSTNIELISNWRAERLFDLFCLDAWMLPTEKQKVSLANCLQPMRLRLDAIERPGEVDAALLLDDPDTKEDDGDSDVGETEGVLGSIVVPKKSPPSIELVLQTKWPGAVVDYLTLPDGF